MSIQPDTLSREELAQSYGYALQVIYSVPELKALFERAVNAKKGQWTPDRFRAALFDTTWYKENDEFARRAWAAEQLGGADWTTSLQTARLAVQDAASEVGANLNPEQLDALARRYVYEGWGSSGRQALLQQALASEITYMPTDSGEMALRGRAGTLTDELRSIAFSNGLRFNDEWYLQAARSVASQLTDADYWQREIRRQAASMYPIYAEQINAGVNAIDIASPYINIYAQTMEQSPYDLGLDHPDIRRAMMSGTGLFDFQQSLRERPEWQNTKQAEDRVSEISLQVMKMFGLVG